MTSIFNQLLIALQSKILSDIPDDGSGAGIRYIDQDFGQVDAYEIKPSVSFPCILIDFSETSYQQKQFKTQWANMNILMRLCFDPYSISNSLAPQDVREKALQYYELENKLYLSLQDWVAGGLLMNPFSRLKAITEKREDKFRIRNILFKAVYEDRGLALQ